MTSSCPIVCEMPETVVVVVLSWRRDDGASDTFNVVPLESKVIWPLSAGTVSHGIAEGRGVHAVLVESVSLQHERGKTESGASGKGTR
jgi:hypothetical protein